MTLFVWNGSLILSSGTINTVALQRSIVALTTAGFRWTKEFDEFL